MRIEIVPAYDLQNLGDEERALAAAAVNASIERMAARTTRLADAEIEAAEDALSALDNRMPMSADALRSLLDAIEAAKSARLAEMAKEIRLVLPRSTIGGRKLYRAGGRAVSVPDDEG